jgi:hypothetical protein
LRVVERIPPETSGKAGDPRYNSKSFAKEDVMRTAIVVLGAVLLAGAAPSAQNKSNAEIEKVLVGDEQALYQAVATANKAAFVALVAPAGVWTTPFGFVPMNRLADSLASFKLPEWGGANIRVTWRDDNAALVSYTRTGGGEFSHQSFATTTLATTLWTKHDGKWVAVHHQETDLTQ